MVVFGLGASGIEGTSRYNSIRTGQAQADCGKILDKVKLDAALSWGPLNQLRGKPDTEPVLLTWDEKVLSILRDRPDCKEAVQSEYRNHRNKLYSWATSRGGKPTWMGTRYLF